MTSNINTSGINSAFPYAGQDNPSNGFRTNWAQISNNLNIAHDEITALQNQIGGVTSNLSLTLTGDITAPTTVLPGGATMTTTLKSRGIGTQEYNSATQDVSLTVNDSGIITGFTINNSSSTSTTTYPITITTSETSNGKTVSSAVIPQFSVSPNGKIESVTNETLSFSLFGYGLKQGSTIVGNSNNLSDLISPTAAKQVLYYDGTNTVFHTLSITDFDDIDFTGAQTGQVLTYNGAKWIPQTVQTSAGGFDPNSIKVETSMPSDASFIISETDSNGNVTLESLSESNMLSYLSSNIAFNLFDDKSPELGGPLNINGQSMVSGSSFGITVEGSMAVQIASGSAMNVAVGTNTSATIGDGNVVISSPLFSIVSGSSNITMNSSSLTLNSNTSIKGTLNVNGVQYPSTLPSSAGMFLSCDNTGKTSWTVPSVSASSIFSKMPTSTKATKNSGLMIYDPTSSTGTLIAPSSLFLPFYGKYYVSTNGVDATADGSISAPFATLSGLFSVFSSNSSATYTNVEVIFDGGSYDLSGVTVPTNITNLYFSTIDGRNSIVNIVCQNGTYSIQNTTLTVSDINWNCSGTIISSTVNFFRCSFSGSGTYTFNSGNSTNNPNNSGTLLFEDCSLNMTGGGVTIYGYSNVNVIDLYDITKTSTMTFGNMTYANSDTCVYVFSKSSIGNMNVYSGDAYIHACEFYQNFISKQQSNSNILSVNNCNFVDSVIIGASSCNVNVDNPYIGLYHNNNRYIKTNKQTNNSISTLSVSNSSYTYSGANCKVISDIPANYDANNSVGEQSFGFYICPTDINRIVTLDHDVINITNNFNFADIVKNTFYANSTSMDASEKWDFETDVSVSFFVNVVIYFDSLPNTYDCKLNIINNIYSFNPATYVNSDNKLFPSIDVIDISLLLSNIGRYEYVNMPKGFNSWGGATQYDYPYWVDIDDGVKGKRLCQTICLCDNSDSVISTYSNNMHYNISCNPNINDVYIQNTTKNGTILNGNMIITDAADIPAVVNDIPPVSMNITAAVEVSDDDNFANMAHNLINS